MSDDCNALHPVTLRKRCSLAPGHDGPHEAHATPDNSDDPAAAWESPDN